MSPNGFMAHVVAEDDEQYTYEGKDGTYKELQGECEFRVLKFADRCRKKRCEADQNADIGCCGMLERDILHEKVKESPQEAGKSK